MERILNVSNLSYTYHTLQGETRALDSVTFSVGPGEFAAFVGPSGCGKTTLLNIIAGILKEYDGELQSVSPIGYMFQRDLLLEWRTIYKNVILGLEVRHRVNAETRQRVGEMLEKYGLSAFKNAYPRQLSGGMRQRAALVRTLALSPKLLLLDEPFSALDAQTRLDVSSDIGMMIREEGITTIMVTHDLQEAVSMADRIFVLSQRPGRIKKEIPIRFSKIGLTPVEKRQEPEFQTYFLEVWREISDEKKL